MEAFQTGKCLCKQCYLPPHGCVWVEGHSVLQARPASAVRALLPSVSFPLFCPLSRFFTTKEDVGTTPANKNEGNYHVLGTWVSSQRAYAAPQPRGQQGQWQSGKTSSRAREASLPIFLTPSAGFSSSSKSGAST